LREKREDQPQSKDPYLLCNVMSVARHSHRWFVIGLACWVWKSGQAKN